MAEDIFWHKAIQFQPKPKPKPKHLIVVQYYFNYAHSCGFWTTISFYWVLLYRGVAALHSNTPTITWNDQWCIVKATEERKRNRDFTINLNLSIYDDVVHAAHTNQPENSSNVVIVARARTLYERPSGCVYAILLSISMYHRPSQCFLIGPLADHL